MGTKGKWGSTMLGAVLALALASPAVAARPADKPTPPGHAANDSSVTLLPVITVAPVEVADTATVVGDAAWSDESAADDVLADAAWSDAAWSDVSVID
jgi:hypothetical protein